MRNYEIVKHDTLPITAEIDRRHGYKLAKIHAGGRHAATVSSDTELSGPDDVWEDAEVRWCGWGSPTREDARLFAEALLFALKIAEDFDREREL